MTGEREASGRVSNCQGKERIATWKVNYNTDSPFDSEYSFEIHLPIINFAEGLLP